MARLRSHLWAPVAGAALLAASGFGAGASQTHAASVCVNPAGSGGCKATIQAAVDAASPGDTIDVAAGTYKEMVSINKAVSLTGAGAASTIIDATGLDHAIAVIGVKSPASISGFTLENANLAGLLLRDSHALTVADNTVQNNDNNRGPSAPPGQGTCPGAPSADGDDCGEGIHFQGVTDSIISGNTVQGNHGGMLVTDESGPTHDNQIIGNTIQNNTDDCGITLASHPSLTPPTQPGPPSSGGGVWGNLIEDNMVMGNGAAGVGIFGTVPGSTSHSNVVMGNTIMNNGLPGVTLHIHSSGVTLDNNLIVGNTISGNGADPGVNTAKTGVEAFADPTGGAATINGTLVAENTISGQDAAVWVGSNATDISVHGNNFAGSTAGVVADGPASADADWNYWGCAGGPNAAGCATMKGSVDADAWMPAAPTASSSMP